MNDLINTIKNATTSPRNDKMLHFSQHLMHDRHTVLYHWFGYPTVTNEPWAGVIPLLQGNAIHNQIHSIMDKAYDEYHSEVGIIPEDEDFHYPWTGTADAYIKRDNEWWLIDYKTISGTGITFLQEPRAEHIAQVSCYYHFNYWQPARVGILYLPTTPDYKRRWHEPQLFEVEPVKKQILLDRIGDVESAISVYASTRMLPEWPQGEYKWKENKRNKNYELHYKPHYSSMFCPWRYLADDDPCGCSQQKQILIGKIDYDKVVIDGDEDTLLAYVDEIVE